MGTMFGKKIDIGDYMTEMCPACKQISPYIANPFYLYECKLCGFSGKESDAITVFDDVSFERDVSIAREKMKNHSGISLVSKLKEK